MEGWELTAGSGRLGMDGWEWTALVERVGRQLGSQGVDGWAESWVETFEWTAECEQLGVNVWI